MEIEELFGLPAHPLAVHAAAGWTVVEVGHSGARATWNDVGADGG